MSNSAPDHWGPKLAEQLADKLQRPLPGRSAQERFAPSLCYGRHFGPPSKNARPASVLILLVPGPSGWYLPLTIRPSRMRHHPGQICLPGGANEAGESPEQTALRELQEELNVGSDDVRILGRLSPLYLYISNFQIVTCIGVVGGEPQFEPHSDEVSVLLKMPLVELTNSQNHSLGMRTFPAPHLGEGKNIVRTAGGQEQTQLKFSAPEIRWRNYRVWGATALMLGELIAILDEIKREPRPTE